MTKVGVVADPVILHAARLRAARDKLNWLISGNDNGSMDALEEVVAALIYVENAAREARKAFWPEVKVG